MALPAHQQRVPSASRLAAAAERTPLTVSLATSGRRTFQPIVLSVLAVATAVGIGGLVTRSTHGAVALSAAVLLGAIIVTAERRPIAQVFMGVVVLMSALVDLPSRLPDCRRFQQPGGANSRVCCSSPPSLSSARLNGSLAAQPKAIDLSCYSRPGPA